MRHFEDFIHTIDRRVKRGRVSPLNCPPPPPPPQQDKDGDNSASGSNEGEGSSGGGDDGGGGGGGNKGDGGGSNNNGGGGDGGGGSGGGGNSRGDDDGGSASGGGGGGGGSDGGGGNAGGGGNNGNNSDQGSGGGSGANGGESDTADQNMEGEVEAEVEVEVEVNDATTDDPNMEGREEVVNGSGTDNNNNHITLASAIRRVRSGRIETARPPLLQPIRRSLRRQARGKSTEDESLYRCGECKTERSFKELDAYLDHVQSRHRRRPTNSGALYCCGECPAAFKKRRSLVEHVKAGHNDPRFNCKVCKQPFRRRHSLNQHIRLYHEVDEELFCKVRDRFHYTSDALFAAIVPLEGQNAPDFSFDIHDDDDDDDYKDKDKDKDKDSVAVVSRDNDKDASTDNPDRNQDDGGGDTGANIEDAADQSDDDDDNDNDVVVDKDNDVAPAVQKDAAHTPISILPRSVISRSVTLSAILGDTTAVRRALQSAVTQATFACDYGCGQLFESGLKRHSHHRYHHSAKFKIYQCTLCAFTTVHSSVPAGHLRSQHGLNIPKDGLRQKGVKLWFKAIEYDNPDRNTPRTPKLLDKYVAHLVMTGKV